MKRIFFTTLSFILPLVSAAQGPMILPQSRPALGGTPQGGITAVIAKISDILGLLVPVAVTLALLVFIWGLAVFIKNSGNEDAKEEGKRKMGWGIVALFVIVAIWGIIKFIAGEFDIETGGTIDVPQYPTASQ